MVTLWNINIWISKIKENGLKKCRTNFYVSKLIISVLFGLVWHICKNEELFFLKKDPKLFHLFCVAIPNPGKCKEFCQKWIAVKSKVNWIFESQTEITDAKCFWEKGRLGRRWRGRLKTRWGWLVWVTRMQRRGQMEVDDSLWWPFIGASKKDKEVNFYWSALSF